MIFAHGHTVSDPASRYSTLLQRWAGAGYVVAAPTFPLSSTRLAFGLSDLANQPADVSFVLSQLLALSAAPNGPYTGLIASGRIAVAGHSLGGMTALGVTANSCCADERIKAAVVLAGAERSFLTGSFFTGLKPVPIMIVHGDRDGTVPFADGRKVCTDAAPPKVMLTLLGGDHSSPFGGASGTGDGQARLVATAFLEFLDRYVKELVEGLGRLRAAAAGRPDLRLEVVEA